MCKFEDLVFVNVDISLKLGLLCKKLESSSLSAVYSEQHKQQRFQNNYEILKVLLALSLVSSYVC